ncbi:hypothetical protein [Zobellia barbeyronii]|uniref:Uncharacterized protein n=1 Tax=Zobellia barbeyronii TaxID=2748009 RepID=A0ABS5WIJ3_9FLAO|nr:hypothetical protein [Zobellia barbeyronii]MBT2162823.1 hypothetical protein [Zobellia barbeyronii]
MSSNFKKILKKAGFLVAFLCSFLSYSQSFLITFPEAPENATVCNDATLLKVKMNVIEASTTGATITIDLADGMQYEVGSIVKTGGTSSLTITENGGTPNQPIFTLGPTNLTVGSFIEFTILRKAYCDAYSNVLAGGIFVDKVIGDINGSLSDEETTPYSINYPSLSFVQPATLNDALIGDIKSRTFSITNGADGCANAVHFAIDYNGTGIAQQSLTLDGVTINPTSVVGPVYYYSISGTDLTADSQLCNGETLTFTETIEIKTCSPVTDYQIGWGCNSDPVDWCTMVTGTGGINMATGNPDFKSNRNTRIGYVDMCTPFKVEAEFVNEGTGDTNAATMYNLKLLKGRGTGSQSLTAMSTIYSISNATLNSQSVPWVYVGRKLTVDLEDYFTSDPDGAGVGLDDIDGDGFYDDLPKNSTVAIVVDVAINCASTCGASSVMDNFAGSVKYTTMCDATEVSSQRLYAQGSSLAYTQSAFVTTGYIPANIDDNVPFRTRLSIGYYRQKDDFDSASSRYVYELTLPAGVSVSGTGNVEWRYGEFPGSGNPVSVGYTQTGNVVTITSPNNNIGYALIDLVYDCSSGSELSLNYAFRKINNPATGCSCQGELTCGSLTTNASCPGSCLIGPSSGIPIVRRADNSLGWTDSSMSTKQVAANISAYDLSKALYLDEIEIHGNATQNGASATLGARLVLDKINASTNKITPLKVDVTIIRSGVTVASGTLTSFSMANSTTTDQIIDWNLSALIPNGGLLNGDEIETVSRYQVTSNSMTQHDVQSGGQWYFYNTDAVTGDQVYCNFFTPEMYLVGTRDVIGTNTYSNYGCDIVQLGGSTNYLARRFDTAGFYYQNEYRPVMYVESIEAVIPPGYELIEASISGGGTLTADAVSGNTYTFNNPGDWPGVGLTVTNAYGRLYPFKVRATCETETTEPIVFNFKIKDYYYHYADDNPTSTEQEVIKTNARNITHYEHPEISLTNQTGAIQASEPIESWVVQMANTGSKTAPYNWISIDDVPNVQIERVVDIATGLEVAPTPYPGGNLYLLGTTGLTTSSFKDYRVDFSYTSCVETTLKVFGGWNCNEYPTDPNVETCSKEELDLIFTPASGEVEIISVEEPSSAIDICTPLDYAFNINSVQSGNIKDVMFTIIAPQGMNPVSGSFEAEYPVGSGNWEAIAVSSNTGSNYVYNLTQHTVFPALGLPGTLNDGGDANSRLMATRFKMTSNCNFVAGSNFQVSASANNICGTPALGNSLESQTVSTNVSGVAADYSVVTDVDLVSGSFDNCSTPVVLENTHTIITSEPVGANGFIDIELPIGYSYTANSYTCTSTLCASFDSLETSTNGNEVIKLTISSGMVNGDVFSYTYEVTEDATGFISCGNKTITITSLDETENISCSTESDGFCPILSVQTGEYDYIFNVDRASLVITSTATKAKLSGTNELIATAFSIENTSTFDIASGTIIEAFYDANQNGVYDASEIILDDKILAVGITAGNTISESLSFTIPTSQVCNVVIAVRTSENRCFCADAYTPMVTPASLNGAAGTDKEVCEITSSVTLGNPLAAYTYQWAGISPVETAYLDNTLSASPVFTYNGPKISTPVDLIYTVTVTRPNGCRSTDTMTVTVNPSPQAAVNTTDTSCGLNNGSIEFVFRDYPQETWIEFSLDNGSTYRSQISDAMGSIRYTGLSSGTYDLWARWGDNSCPVDLGNYTINVIAEVNYTTQPTNEIVLVGQDAIFFANVQNANTYQWELSTDNGTTFNTITDGAAYSGTQTTTLTVVKPGMDKNNYQYRLMASNTNTPLCAATASDTVLLAVRLPSVITNRRITHRVKKQ